MFANKRKALSKIDWELIVLHDPDLKKENIFDASREDNLTIYLGQSKICGNILAVCY